MSIFLGSTNAEAKRLASGYVGINGEKRSLASIWRGNNHNYPVKFWSKSSIPSNIFIIVGYDSNGFVVSHRSDDLINWEQMNNDLIHGTVNEWAPTGVIFAFDRFLFFMGKEGYNGHILISTDGHSWSKEIPIDMAFTTFAYGNGCMIAGNKQDNGKSYITRNGEDWEEINQDGKYSAITFSEENALFYAITYGGGSLDLVSNNSDKTETRNWEIVSNISELDRYIGKMSAGYNTIIYEDIDLDSYMITQDYGASWEEISSPFSSQWSAYDMIFWNEKLLVCSITQPRCVYSYLPDISFNNAKGTLGAISSFTTTEDKVIACGNTGGYLYTSEDGENWSRISSPSGSLFPGITHS
jgi:hypothetical protein